MVASILHVDDDPLFQRLVSGRLTAFGYLVRSARGGAEGVALLTEVKPEIVLMDIDMPEIDGYQATAMMRERHFAGLIIALTASERVRDLANAVLAGCDDYIPKPIGDDFEALIAAALARFRSNPGARTGGSDLEGVVFGNSSG